MSGVEFVPQPEDDDRARHRTRRAARVNPLDRVPRRVLMVGAAALAAVVVAVVVVAQRPTDQHPAAARTYTAVRSAAAPAPAPSPTVSTLDLPEQLAFGPATSGVLAVGNRIYGVTTHLVGAVQRDGGELVVRPTTAGLMSGTPSLFLDQDHSTVWTVGIGGTSIGSFGTVHLSTRDDQNAPAPIRAAAAYGGELWFVTAQGLYRIAPGWRGAELVRSQRGLAAVAADPTRHRVLAVGSAGVQAFTAMGTRSLRVPLPFAHADDVTVADGQIWLAGHNGSGGLLLHLDPASLRRQASSATQATTGAARVLTTFSNRLVVSGIGADATMACLDADSGAVLQTWPYEHGAVALNDRGMLVSRGYGIETRNARDCLAGAS